MKRGDVVLCKLEKDRLVLHRLVKIKVENGNKNLLIQGDALLIPDAWVAMGQVLGLATVVYRSEKRISLDGGFVIFLARIWMGLAPMRPLIIDLWHGLRGIKERLA